MIKLLLKSLFGEPTWFCVVRPPLVKALLTPEPDAVLKNMVNTLEVCQKFERTTPVKCCFYVFSVESSELSSHSLLMHLQPLIGKSMLVACLEFLVSV